MARTNNLTTAPPFAVENAIRTLGQNLRTARLRPNLTIEAVAEKIGTGPRAVADAEKGKPTTAIAVYTALLWSYNCLTHGLRWLTRPRTARGFPWPIAANAPAAQGARISTMTSSNECFV